MLVVAVVAGPLNAFYIVFRLLFVCVYHKHTLYSIQLEKNGAFLIVRRNAPQPFFFIKATIHNDYFRNELLILHTNENWFKVAFREVYIRRTEITEMTLT